MHRPLIWFSAAFAAGCALSLLSVVSLPLTAVLIVLVLSVTCGKFLRRLLPVCVLVAGIVCGISYTTAYHTYITDPIADLAGVSQRVTVTATGYATQYDDSQRIKVKIKGSEVGRPVGFSTLVYLPLTEDEIQPGDKINGRLDFYMTGVREGFDKESYYRSLGYPVLASVSDGASIEVTAPEHRPLSYYPKRLAHSLCAVFAQHGTERQAAFWSALTTGDRSALTTLDTDHMRRAGLSHVIALSGLHVGFLISILLLVCGRRVGTVLGVPILAAFLFMVGWSPSVARACLMYGILLVSFQLRRQSDSFTSLSAALLIILVLLPDALMSVSLQLSFASTLGILCFASRIQRLLSLPKGSNHFAKRVYQTLLGSVICTICSTAFTAPILLYHFGYLSVFSVFSNMLALWAVSLLFPLLVIGGLIGIKLAPVAAIILIPARWLTDYIYKISDLIAGIPYGILYCESVFDFCIAVVLSAVTVLLLWKGGKRVLMGALPAVVLCVIGISVWRGVAGADDLRIAVLSEGSGQAIVVSCDGKAALIDCSGSSYHNAAEDVIQYLDWQGIDALDWVILTSVDKTHARNICELLDTVPVKQMILPEKSYENREPYPQLMEKISSLEIDCEKVAPETETDIADPALGLTILGSIERKLAVRIQSEDQDILIVHALTQNMLLELTEQTSLSCDTLIVSGGFTEDSDKMDELLKRFAPRQIVLENGWTSSSYFNNIPVLNPYYIGEIDWKTIRN
ncbi:MAG: ComEC/Rec2 family competence protein [Eubacteriales bacterium]|nr:ComEC/Rec2 family competence protein [Eubacteriales bacterium]